MVFATAKLSANPTIEMAKATGNNCLHTSQSKTGKEREGNPEGTSPTIRTPSWSRFPKVTNEIPNTTATKGDGKNLCILLPNFIIKIPNKPIPNEYK